MKNPNVIIHRFDRTYLTEWMNPVPVRPWWRVYWNPTPGALIVSGQQNFFPDREHILVIPPYTAVTQKMLQPFETLFVHFSLNGVRGCYTGGVFLLESKPFDTMLAQFPAGIEYGDLSPSRRLRLLSWIFAILGELPELHWRIGHVNAGVEKIIHLLDKQPTAKMDNSHLAKLAGMSRNGFIRKFREVTGSPPLQYAIRRRLDLAAQLLTETDRSLEEIAESCGFCDRNYFTRMFTAEYTMSPAAYRRADSAP
jgi:Transcriptional regulator containing an amidase domain and an AraC-type DNA-binding HTH domain